MAQLMDRLSALKVGKVTKPGMYLDGSGLYLQVSGDGKTKVAKSWIFRFKFNGRQRDMGLGSILVLNLAEAREKATECRRQIAAGIDPLEVRKAQRTETKLEEAKALTFEQCAEKYIAAHKAGWKNQKHIDQWTSSLKTYAYPIIGALPVQKVETAQVMDVLEPIWTTKTETAGRVRGRIEMVLGWAKVRGHRKGDNPARWRDHLDKLLPRPSKVRKVKHHPALPYDEMGTFMQQLRKEEGMAARALEFTILTIARTTEALVSEWPEIGPLDKLWIVPAGRMKGDREHRVPLSAPVGPLLKKMRKEKQDGSDLIFPGPKEGKPLSENAMLALLDRMGYGHVTVHGFRSTFRDWAADCTDYPDSVAEVALSHVNDDETEAAYKRTDLFEKRRSLIEDWAKFCAKANDASISNLAEKNEERRFY